MRSLKRSEGMNVVPFIDILLVLLAIVFVISNFIALGQIQIDLPQAASAKELPKTNHHIAVDNEGKFFFNDTAVSKRQLQSEIEGFNAQDTVIISSDKKAVYEDFIYVIDTLKAQNIEKISMAVEK
ncbi:MAG: ExbD/TolR family protein [Campylobacterota bacterium]